VRRFPKYISPSAYQTYLKNPEEYYMRYKAPIKPPNLPQTHHMAIGSSFDAYVKSSLYHRVFGKNDPKFEFEALFESQVESHNRAQARGHGKHVYDEYMKNNCFADLMLDLSASPTEPRFETSVERVIDGVPLSGKPDLSFSNKEGALIVLDWKVNGYYSTRTTSPMVGYLRSREDGAHHGAHGQCMRFLFRGVYINAAHTLDILKEDWAIQLGLYSWCLGQDVGNDSIFAIDQICGRPGRDKPFLKFAEHRLRISQDFQKKAFNQMKALWSLVTSDHFFRGLPKDQSEAKCAALDSAAERLHGTGSDMDKWFNEVTRSQ